MNVLLLKKQKKYEQGSFLLEMLIAFTIISIALTVIVDAFITSQRSYRITADQANLTRALTMVLEDMSQEAKVSEAYGCGVGFTSPCTKNKFSMTHIEGLNGQPADEIVSYSFTGSEILKTTISGILSSQSKITPPSVKVDSFNVISIGTSGIDQVRTFVTITAHATNDPNMKVHLQSSFTERIY